MLWQSAREKLLFKFNLSPPFKKITLLLWVGYNFLCKHLCRCRDVRVRCDKPGLRHKLYPGWWLAERNSTPPRAKRSGWEPARGRYCSSCGGPRFIVSGMRNTDISRINFLWYRSLFGKSAAGWAEHITGQYSQFGHSFGTLAKRATWAPLITERADDIKTHSSRHFRHFVLRVHQYRCCCVHRYILNYLYRTSGKHECRQHICLGNLTSEGPCTRILNFDSDKSSF